MKFIDRLVKSKVEEGRRRVDSGLPLGLRIGSKIRLPVGSWVLYKNDFLMQRPIKEGEVLFYSRAQIDGFSYYRFYVGTEGRTQVILQMRMYAGEVAECLAFTPFSELSFHSEREWEQWTGVNGRIGLEEFVNDGTKIPYQRIWGNPDEPWVDPFFYIEEVTCGPFEGDSILEVGAQSMLFGRWVKEDVIAEHLMAELQEREETMFISVKIGIEIPHQAIKILP